ncbi:putative proline--tRNA ligase [Medicago truncatula]|uniref:proline--tRNA ligase n=1 Tax=Medicago truncatula TaxID=3880 RepID=A0A396J052_MEDTR|nr:putative proline--tRNA ligase [Medicago truncatula]
MFFGCCSAELIEHYDISGLYILRPSAVEIWETLQAFFDSEIKKMNVENCYFPMFVLDCHLKKEKAHNEGFKQVVRVFKFVWFAPKYLKIIALLNHLLLPNYFINVSHFTDVGFVVAWVTKSGHSDLEAHLALRPSSETIMYPYYSKWIRGHRDLPLKLNQWCNVVRWVVGDPTPFIRSREFLWQEGHSAFATEDEAHAEVFRQVAFIPNTGCGIQGATTHCLRQKFAEKFEVKFEDMKGEKAMVWQNSWGYSTRTIGAMVMVHGDDKGLVLPPKVASTQVIVIPVPYKDQKIRAELDSRDNCSPERKYSDWELKGVPLRIEIGPKDLVNKQVCVVLRDNGAKMDIANADLVEEIKKLLNIIQQNMFDVAKQKRDECIQVIHTWEEFKEALNQRKMILAPWCDEKVEIVCFLIQL